MDKVLQRRIMPAATVEGADTALALAGALMEAGLDIIEVTFRKPGAADAIRAIAQAFPQMCVGAGTVLSMEQLHRARDAGAQFAVSPGLDEELVAHAAEMGVPFIPGVCTPGEVQRALRLKCMLQKFFPAEACGGVKVLRALAGPFGHTGVRFLPTGGINAANAKAYLDLPVVAAVGGSWMVESKLIAAKHWKEVTRLSREAIALAKAPSLAAAASA